jgi:methylamine dehydrogenase accessory protein MauD
MPDWWVALTVALWLFVVVQGALLLGVLRQLGVLHRRLDELTATSDEPTGPAVGALAPDFTLPQVGGGALRLGDLRGSPVLLGFVSPGCPPCTQLAQELDALLNRAEAPHVLLVSSGDESANAAWSNSLGLRAPVLLWERGDMRAYQAHYTPFLVALDGAGVVRSVGLVSSREKVEQFLARATGSPGGEPARSVLAEARA